MTTAAAPATASLSDDARTIGLVGMAHGTSHFFHMLLPPLFPLFIRDFGVTYSELGLLVSVFFVVSGIGQALSGFLVDKVGARPVLFAALACFVAAGFATATASGYAGLALAAALAGLGNSPFHPVDFTILNKRVSSQRLGHAFSVHGITGNLGWAVAPVFLTVLTAWFGSWRWAAACAGLWALLVLTLMWWHRASIDDRSPAAGPVVSGGPKPDTARATGAAAATLEHPLAFLKLPSVWLCFSFFFWVTVAYAAIQGFASPALHQIHGTPLAQTAFVVSGFMVCGAMGMVVGGFLASKAERLERVIAVCFIASAALMLLAATGWAGGWGSILLVVLSGFGPGLAGPSRDMLIKRAAPPGATGRVYGTVYSGLDVGFATAAPMFGWLLDHGHASSVFTGSGLAMVAGVASAALVGMRVHAARQPVKSAA